MASATIAAVKLSLDIFAKEDYSKLDRIEELEQQVDDYEDKLVNNYVSRMTTDTNPLGSIIFSDIVTDMERCSDHAINIAYSLKERPSDM